MTISSGCRLRDLLPEIDNDDAGRQPHDHGHDVLHHDDGDALVVEFPDDGERRFRFRHGEARHHLVEQDAARIGGDAFGKLKQLLVLQRQRHWRLRLLAGETDAIENMGGVFDGLAYRPARQRRGGHDIERRHVGEGLDDLEAADQAAAHQPIGRDADDAGSVEPHVACVRRHEAGNHPEQRGLAGAVRADDPDDLALRHREADRIQRDQPAIALGDTVDFKKGHRLGSGARPRRGLSELLSETRPVAFARASIE